MGYRDPLEAALARIAALETEIRLLEKTAPSAVMDELMEARAKLAIQRADAEAQATIHAFELERIAAERKQELEINSVRLKSEQSSLEAELTVAQSRVEFFQAEVARRDARVAELEAELARALSTPRGELAAHYARRERELEAELAAIDSVIAQRAPGPDTDEAVAAAMRAALEAERQARHTRADAELARVRRALELLGER